MHPVKRVRGYTRTGSCMYIYSQKIWKLSAVYKPQYCNNHTIEEHPVYVTNANYRIVQTNYKQKLLKLVLELFEITSIVKDVR